jgi:hypothetical protein
MNRAFSLNRHARFAAGEMSTRAAVAVPAITASP